MNGFPTTLPPPLSLWISLCSPPLSSSSLFVSISVSRSCVPNWEGGRGGREKAPLFGTSPFEGGTWKGHVEAPTRWKAHSHDFKILFLDMQSKILQNLLRESICLECFTTDFLMGSQVVCSRFVSYPFILKSVMSRASQNSLTLLARRGSAFYSGKEFSQPKINLLACKHPSGRTERISKTSKGKCRNESDGWTERERRSLTEITRERGRDAAAL